MSMLSRLLKDGADVLPLTPRRWVSAGYGRAADDPFVAEAVQLRAALAELALQAKEQAKQAYDAGRAAGEAAARERLEAPIRGLAEKLGAAATEVVQTRADVLHRAEADAVRLAVEIARRILHRELATDASALDSLMRAALEKLQTQEVYRVRVHPGQERLLKACLEQAGRSQGVSVIGDPAQPEGSALFEVSGGALDASVDTQVREIERALMDQIEGRV